MKIHRKIVYLLSFKGYSTECSEIWCDARTLRAKAEKCVQMTLAKVKVK